MKGKDMIRFENIHKNKKWAFVDGLLCGLCFAWIAKLWREAVGESQEERDARNKYESQPYD